MTSHAPRHEQGPSLRSPCLFCQSTTGKRSREHVFRRAFKKQIRPAPSLNFSYLYDAKVELDQWPISQFDMTVNDVCKECNEGWLNDLENDVSPILDNLLTNRDVFEFSQDEARLLGFWAYVRSLLRTHVSPRGRAPRALFQQAYSSRRVGEGCFVEVGVSTHYVWDAGAHQSVTILDDEERHYVASVAFGLDSLLFLTAISDGRPLGRRRALDVVRQPRLWFPTAFRWLSPPEIAINAAVPRILTAAEAQIAGVSLALRIGVTKPLDQFGAELDPMAVIPERFLGSLDT